MDEKQDFKIEELPKDTLVLVGFGEHSLETVLSWRGTEKELDALQASVRWPPRYRELRICDKEDVDRFIHYTEWVATTGFRAGIAF